MNITAFLMDFNVYSLVYIAFGMSISALVSLIYIHKLQKETKMLKRQYEKKSQGMDDSSLRVKTLENKIKTLETALRKQMDSK